MEERTIRILLLEDSRADAKLVRTALTASTGPVYELAEAVTLSQGLECLREGADIILTDLTLPDSEGVDTVQRLREAAPDTPMVVLTGSESDGLAYIAAGAHDYLSKAEFHPLGLQRALSYALERHHQSEIAALREALARYRDLTSDGIGTATTRRISGMPPLRERSPETFDTLGSRYSELFELYLEHLSVHNRKPTREMQKLAARLGDLGVGPRELIDLHVESMERAMRQTRGERARAYASEGRLLALEMMGQLVEYYRAGVLRSRPAEVK